MIVPSEAVLDDSEYDIWGEIRPRIVEALGAAFDSAVYFGTTEPASWPTGLIAQAVAASDGVDHSSAAGDLRSRLQFLARSSAAGTFQARSVSSRFFHQSRQD